MVDFLRDFVHILRSSDLRISTSESIDAMKVISKVGIQDRNILKDSLSFSLAKTMREKEIFSDCFDDFFRENYMNFEKENSSLGSEQQTEEVDDLDTWDDGAKNKLENLYKNSDKNSLMTAMALAARESNLQDIRLFTQVGMFTRKIFDEMGLETLNNDIFLASRMGDINREEELKAFYYTHLTLPTKRIV